MSFASIQPPNQIEGLATITALIIELGPRKSEETCITLVIFENDIRENAPIEKPKLCTLTDPYKDLYYRNGNYRNGKENSEAFLISNTGLTGFPLVTATAKSLCPSDVMPDYAPQLSCRFLSERRGVSPQSQFRRIGELPTRLL